MREKPLTRLVLEGLSAALVHADMVIYSDTDSFGKEDQRRQAAADAWLKSVLEKRGLIHERPR